MLRLITMTGNFCQSYSVCLTSMITIPVMTTYSMIACYQHDTCLLSDCSNDHYLLNWAATCCHRCVMIRQMGDVELDLHNNAAVVQIK